MLHMPPAGQAPPPLAGEGWAEEGAAAGVAHAAEAAGSPIEPLTWACGACTFENAEGGAHPMGAEGGAWRCEICETPRPGW